jgi:hypothetical protein
MHSKWSNSTYLNTHYFVFVGFFLIIIINISCFANEQRNNVLKEALKNFLNQQSVIRIPITDSGGFGHQSAAATLITRLRQLGYEGQIEVVYELSYNLKNKFPYLFPPFESISSI